VRLTSDAYFVYKRDGSSGTGLAITPQVLYDSAGNVTTDTRRWYVTHLNSGKVVNGPFDSLDEAQGLPAPARPGCAARTGGWSPDRVHRLASLRRPILAGGDQGDAADHPGLSGNAGGCEGKSGG